MMIQYRGKEADSMVLAAKAGITHATLMNRLYNGWDVDDALGTPLMQQHTTGPTKVTKCEAERWLNEKKPWELPIALKKAMDGYVRGRIGSYLRIYQPKAFNSWFSNEFLKMRLG